MEAQSKLGSIADHVRHYAETRAKLTMLDAAEKTSSTVSLLGYYLVTGVILTFVLLFLSIGAAVWIGHSYGETSMGFLIVGLFYLIVAAIIFIGRQSLIRTPIINSILKVLYSDEKD